MLGGKDTFPPFVSLCLRNLTLSFSHSNLMTIVVLIKLFGHHDSKYVYRQYFAEK